MNHLNSLVMGCKLGPESKVAWSNLIPFVFSLVNNTPKNPLGISPLSMLYGVFANYDRPLLPTNQANAQGSTSNPADYVDHLMSIFGFFMFHCVLLQYGLHLNLCRQIKFLNMM